MDRYLAAHHPQYQHGTVKVDSARKRGGIKIVWLSWFTDSIALWHRQDETPYLLDEPTLVNPQPTTSPTTDLHQISSDPEPDNDDWDEEAASATVVKSENPFESAETDWSAVMDEVDAAMDDSDAEDEDDGDAKSDRSGMRSGHASDDEESATDGSQSAMRYLSLL